MILRHVECVGDDAPAHEIVICGRTIISVGQSIDSSPEGPIIELGDAIAFPGLTNSHDHLEFNLYPALGHKRYRDYLEWGLDIHHSDASLISSIEGVPLSLRLRWGALKNLLCGVTNVAHHGESYEALERLPVTTVRSTSIHSVRSHPYWRLLLNAPLCRTPYVFHVGEGTSPEAEKEVDDLLRWNLFRKPLVGVHAIAMRRDQAPSFRAVVWCPLSNEFLYGVTADVDSLKRSTTVLFGTDSTLTADWNFWNHLRRARAIRALDDRELFDAVTRAAASVWRFPMGGRIGSGERADLVVARKKEPNRWDAFFAVEPEDILLVLVDGVIVMCDRSLGLAPGSRSVSAIRFGASEKIVAEDVPGLLSELRRHGIGPNLPITHAVTA